ncbi:MAG: 6-carboxytetrahydropterin synthase [Porphyromonas sp.]|nr:6-carboxytetrahydropterin synthase [Porphyromonas sp.]
MSNTIVQAERYHDVCFGHRVVNHESKCKHLHGHNYRFYFVIEAENGLDPLGRVLDFSIIKETLCEWLEQEWDHRFLLFEEDPYLSSLQELSPESIVVVPFNPTAENIALHMIHVVAPPLLAPYGCRLVECRVEETRKCTATAKIGDR